jgi:hypothetical protein
MTSRLLTIGLSEQRLRETLEQELLRAMPPRAAVPTVEAVAHAVARAIELDNLAIAEQLQAAGVPLNDDGDVG